MTTATECPHWATSIVANYRRAFAERFGRETTLSDGAVFAIERKAPVMPSAEEQDETVLDLMAEAEQSIAPSFACPT